METKTKTIIGKIVVVVLIIILTVFVYFIYKNAKNNQQITDQNSEQISQSQPQSRVVTDAVVKNQLEELKRLRNEAGLKEATTQEEIQSQLKKLETLKNN